jgi:hypothetical protein
MNYAIGPVVPEYLLSLSVSNAPEIIDHGKKRTVIPLAWMQACITLANISVNLIAIGLYRERGRERKNEPGGRQQYCG